MDTNEDADSDTDAFTYCNPDAQFHRDPCAKLYLHADGHGCGNADCNGNPHTNSHADRNADTYTNPDTDKHVNSNADYHVHTGTDEYTDSPGSLDLLRC